ncbi:hypothetical protein [Pseudobacteriovorax antillogorgiicola]|uniref:hypothetical protein n=1 Tax=Pseudobacteriovorax antillogorgiicola TaxID=1513793 RepID=UPI00104DB2AC|nr:hypothetical protein [Pseudobacteriovorax antillogorgiicola]
MTFFFWQKPSYLGSLVSINDMFFRASLGNRGGFQPKNVSDLDIRNRLRAVISLESSAYHTNNRNFESLSLPYGADPGCMYRLLDDRY